MEIMVFGKQGCASCQTTKNKFEHFLNKYEYSDKVSMKFFDMETEDGLAEGAFNDVLKIPTTILKNKDDKILFRCEGQVPNRQEFEEFFKGL